MDLEIMNSTLLNISGILEKINSSLSDNTSNYIALFSCIIALISVLYAWKSQKDNFFKNTFDTLISQYREELLELDKEMIKCDLFDCIKNIYDKKGSCDFNRSELVNNSVYINCFILIYRILKLIDEEKFILAKNKKKYSGIIRSIIPNDLLWLVMLNSLQRNSDNKILFTEYKNLLAKYKIFEHIKVIHNSSSGIENGKKYIEFYACKRFFRCYNLEPFDYILKSFN